MCQEEQLDKAKRNCLGWEILAIYSSKISSAFLLKVCIFG